MVWRASRYAHSDGDTAVGMKRHLSWAWRLSGLVILVLIAFELWFAGRILTLRWIEPARTSFMSTYVKETNKVPRYVWVDYEDISLQVKRAVLASEDAKFTTHGGFDWDSLRHAASQNVKHGRIVSGGSTITQQLAKNLFLSPTRSIWRKAQESIVAVMLEIMLPKQRIFEIYLNVIEWGRGIYGIEAAANHYFNQRAKDLTEYQAAILASYIPAPRRHHVIGDTEQSLRKVKVIRGRMMQIKLPNK